MGDHLPTGKPSRYVTSHPGQLSLAILLWVGTMSTCKSWGVNGHTVWYTSPVFVVSQCKLVSGWGLRKVHISIVPWALWLRKDFTYFFTIYLPAMAVEPYHVRNDTVWTILTAPSRNNLPYLLTSEHFAEKISGIHAEILWKPYTQKFPDGNSRWPWPTDKQTQYNKHQDDANDLQDLGEGPSWNEYNECRRESGTEVTSPFPLERSPLSCWLLPIGWTWWYAEITARQNTSLLQRRADTHNNPVIQSIKLLSSAAKQYLPHSTTMLAFI